MKLTSILLLAITLHVSAKGVGQTVSFSGNQIPLESVFPVIKQQTGYVVFCNAEAIKAAKPVTIRASRMPLEDFIKSLLQEQPLEYTIKKKTIVISLKQNQPFIPPTNLSPVNSVNELSFASIRGVVRDTDGEPVSRANIMIKGSKKGVAANEAGAFTIDANVGDVLTITSIGYQPTEYTITATAASGGQSELVIEMKRSESKLDEVQVIAYGTSSQRFQTGNVSTVKAADIANQPIQNPLLALQGRVPGVIIRQENGMPGGPVTIQIQGRNSILKGNDPLIVVDGVPYFSTMPRTGQEDVLGLPFLPSNPSPLNFIDPSSIESIDVLKDADATAIYGSRAANGAILITTKKGKVGKTSVTARYLKGVSKVTRMMPMLNTREYLDMRYEGYKNDGVNINTLAEGARTYDLKLWDTTRYTNWQKELIGGNAQYDNLNLTVTGGSATSKYLLGATYNRQTTVFPGDFAAQSGGVNFNMSNTSLNKKFSMDFSGNYQFNISDLPGVDLTNKAILMEPLAPALYNPDGTLNWAPNASGVSTWENPLVNLFHKKFNAKTNTLFSNLVLGYEIIKGLKAKTSFGYNRSATSDYLTVSLLSYRPENRPTSERSAGYGDRQMSSWIAEPQLTYDTKWGNSDIDVLVGSTFQHSSTTNSRILVTGFNSDAEMLNRGAGTRSFVYAPNFFEYKYNAIFGRVNYRFKDKYILNLSARRDGSSRFGENNRFQNFGSIGAAWIFSEEAFVKNLLPVLSYGKIRASYGTTGSDQIGDYGFLSLYEYRTPTIPYQGVPSIRPYVLTNPNLQWEETNKLQIGLDLGFLKDRIVVSATYGRNRSSNQLMNTPLPSITGFQGITANFPATVQNINWEFAVNTANIQRKNLSWKTSANLTLTRNKLVQFDGLAESIYVNELWIGQPLSTKRLYKFGGVNTTNGEYFALDAKGDPTTSPAYPDDYTVYLNTMPKFYGGLQNSFVFHGFSLDFLFQFAKQIGPVTYFNNGSGVTPGRFSSGSSNQPRSVLNRWQKPGDVRDIQKFSNNTLFSIYTANGSDAFYDDASFIRLKNLAIGWSIPGKWKTMLKMQEGRLILQAQNILTITRYKGMDPENQNISTLPPLRTITAGIELSF